MEQELEKLEENCSTRGSMMPVKFVCSVQNIFRECWAQLHSPAGYALDPKFLECQGIDENAEVM